MPEPYISLERVFLQWDEKEDPGNEWYVRHGELIGALTWDDLLEHRRVVILAEAGSGKTREMEEQASRCMAAGKTAFYATVQDVAEEGLDNALPVSDRSRLEAWRASDQPAWFFIDSIDEAKLNGRRLEVAFRKIGDGIAQGPGRAHIVLSGRLTDWQFRDDLAKLEKLLTLPPGTTTLSDLTAEIPTSPIGEVLQQAIRGQLRKPTTDPGERPFVVRLGPLDPDRVRQFAAGRGIEDLDEFTTAIAGSDLWAFARRPLDLQWLIDYWTKNRRFGKLAEMIEVSLSERLQEVNPLHAQNDPISLEAAFQALERIGAAMVFGRVDKIAIPDLSMSAATRPQGLVLREVLPDWSDEHRRRLLSRAAFDPATFGAVRLHNDNAGVVRAFLAARWLARRRRENCTWPEIRALLFTERYGIALIRPSLLQTAAWLSTTDSDVAREVVARDPQVLLNLGDPASLPLDLRRTVLRQAVQEIVENDQRGWIEDETLRRFSSPELAPAVREIWGKEKTHPLVAELLLRIIAHAKLASCADIAIDAAFSPAATYLTFIHAGRALVVIGNDEAIARYATTALDDKHRFYYEVIWPVLDTLFPKHLTIQRLLEVLEHLDPDVRDSMHGFQSYGAGLVRRLDRQEDLEALLSGLLVQLGAGSRDLSSEETDEEKSYYPAMAAAAHRIFTLADRSEAPAIATEATLRLAEERQYRSTEETRAIVRDLRETPTRRRAAFWMAADRFRHHPILQGRPLESTYQMSILGWQPGLQADDLDWILADAVDPITCDTVEKRRLAISAAFDIWGQRDQAPEVLERIRAATANDPASAAMVEARLAPQVPSADDIRFAQQMAASKAGRDAHDGKEQADLTAFIDPLLADPDQMRQLSPPSNGSVDIRLFQLWQILSNMESHRSSFSISDLGLFEAVLGSPLTTAFRDGMIGFWRHWEPTLESSRPPNQRNMVGTIDSMGLAAVAMEAVGNSNWANQLTADQARKATAYATIELGGFPPWLMQLASRWPDEVGSLLAREIVAELDDPAEGLHRGVLEKMEGAPATILAVVAPRLLNALAERPDIPITPLALMLSVLCGGLPRPEATFDQLVHERATTADEPEIAGAYFSAAFQRLPAEAVAALSAKLDGLGFADQRGLVECLLPCLFGDWRVRAIEAPSLPLEVLDRLVRIAFQTVRPEDDNRRPSGEVFSPDGRDNAEHARGALLHSLFAVPGRATVAVLASYKNAAELPFMHHILDDHIFARASQDSEHSPWAPGQAYDFEQTFDNAPRTAAELQELAVRRLAAIQDDLLHGDFAQGRIFKSLPREEDVQTWVAGELRTRQGRAHSVEREPLVVENKEPDIRLRARSTDAALAIEIKVAESWTLLELEEALTDQLCGRYLRSATGRHGLLLIAHQHKRRDGWQAADGYMMSFPEVMAHLAKMADVISATSTDAPQVRVIALDVSSVEVPAAGGATPEAKPATSARARRPAKNPKA